ncbi:hypothetical protein GCM10009733_098920 [Nonomuraea maheshkhaliensis]|uniref:Alpha/beta hydrolase n=1 Tax=Nonomuraea maheshkhaliensis TaxID=419590 RepID=A0ABP4TEZ4_9ACTN
MCRSLSSDAACLRSVVLDSVQGPVVLVGHSYGGSVISVGVRGHVQSQVQVNVQR